MTEEAIWQGTVMPPRTWYVLEQTAGAEHVAFGAIRPQDAVSGRSSVFMLRLVPQCCFQEMLVARTE